ncbi:phosphatase PAP2 family protein [Paenibacillus sp. LMG 31461]|uniref:Phosphatase PAP2 family protein n=1 Tax=Paenibacillus plantarum TaxID=2654975 RepID=A0ABX1XKS5_9BACL|nr:undecaprenyl-diphosphatase [Paenibacillus plantarum]NOU68889.1 phosphatase PAP2 family protein [Paenibacillus plantarum]
MNLAQLDYQWFQTINHFADRFSALNPMVAFFANNLDYVFYLGVIVYWFIRTPDNRKMVVNTLLSAGIALGVNNIIGAIYHRDRPFVAHHVIQLVQHDASASFPSNHAAAAFAVASSIWLWRRKEGRIWFVLAAVIGFSRIWSGIHYPLDIVGGAISGIIIGIVVNKTMRQRVLEEFSFSFIRLYEFIEHKVWKP